MRKLQYFIVAFVLVYNQLIANVEIFNIFQYAVTSQRPPIDNYSNTAYFRGRKYVLGPSQSHFEPR